MNGNEHNEMHELLCAYVLGEASAHDVQRVERALNDSPELRAEKARLEQTIGLVQSAFTGAAELSDERLTNILSAASSDPAPVLQMGSRAPYLRAAAAVLVTAGGVFAVLKYTPTGDGSFDIASVDKELVPIVNEITELERKNEARFKEFEIASAERQQELLESAMDAFAKGDYKAAELTTRLMAITDPENEDVIRLGEEALLAMLSADATVQDQMLADDSEAPRQGVTWHFSTAKPIDESTVMRRSSNTIEEDLLRSAQLGYGSEPVFGGLVTATDPVADQYTGFEISLSQSQQQSDLNIDPQDLFLESAVTIVAGRPVDSRGGLTGSSDFFLGSGEKSVESLYAFNLDVEPAAETRDATRHLGRFSDTSVALDKSNAPERARAGAKAHRGAGGGGAYIGPGDSVLPGAGGSAGAVRLDGGLVRLQEGLVAEKPAALSGDTALFGAYGEVKQPAGPGSPGPAKPEARYAKKDALDSVEAAEEAPDMLADSPFDDKTFRTTLGLEAPAEKPAAGFFYKDSEDGDLAGAPVGNKEAERKRKKAWSADGKSLDPRSGYIGGEEEDLDDDGRRQPIQQSPELLLRSQHEHRERIEHAITTSADRCIRSCFPRPNEQPSAMYYRFWGDNAFELAQLDSQSTFSVDVDTASYALARRYINDGLLPTKAQIRTEEFLNYFDADIPAPTEDTFAIQTELAPSLFGGREDRWMLRVAIRGKEITEEERLPLALTFVIDTSGSMKEENRMELVKHALRLLVNRLDARDSIALVAYSGEARLILPMTPVSQRNVIESAIHPLTPDGSTNAEAGLKMGYAQAADNLRQGTHNRVVLLSDGVANTGQTDQDRINADVKRFRDQGIYLNTIGVGMGNHNDVFLEQLANKGDGICDYVDDEAAAQRAIVERFSGAFQPIASDVKVQVEFDSNQVFRYRLLGYENRAIADADFRNDAVDAGEVGSGHQIVALYEIERTSGSGDGPLATVNLRWKAPKMAGQDPNEIDVKEIKSEVHGANAVASFNAASSGFRQAVLVAQFAEILRRSSHAQGDSFEPLLTEMLKLENELKDADFTEFCLLVSAVGDLMWHQPITRTELQRTVDEYRRFRILNHELTRLKKDLDGELLKELERTNNSLEERIRDLIRSEIQQRNG